MTILSRLFTPTSRRPASTSRDLHSRSRRFDLSGLLGAFGKTADTLQKYQDIPLRFQRQWLTTFLAISMLIGVVAGIYLNVTARAAIAAQLRRLPTADPADPHPAGGPPPARNRHRTRALEGRVVSRPRSLGAAMAAPREGIRATEGSDERSRDVPAPG